jgi:hypothetical protein
MMTKQHFDFAFILTAITNEPLGQGKCETRLSSVQQIIYETLLVIYDNNLKLWGYFQQI